MVTHQVNIAGHGAAYIDTGLLEPNGDVLLNAAVMGARRDLMHIPFQIEAAIRETPGCRTQLEAQVASVPLALGFLDRANNEVLNSVNQTSGTEFFAAGRKSIDALHASADSAASLLDALLQERIAHNTLRRNVILGVVLLAILSAGYLLTGFFFFLPARRATTGRRSGARRFSTSSASSTGSPSRRICSR